MDRAVPEEHPHRLRFASQPLAKRVIFAACLSRPLPLQLWHDLVLPGYAEAEAAAEAAAAAAVEAAAAEAAVASPSRHFSPLSLPTVRLLLLQAAAALPAAAVAAAAAALLRLLLRPAASASSSLVPGLPLPLHRCCMGRLPSCAAQAIALRAAAHRHCYRDPVW